MPVEYVLNDTIAKVEVSDAKGKTFTIQCRPEGGFTITVVKDETIGFVELWPNQVLIK